MYSRFARRDPALYPVNESLYSPSAKWTEKSDQLFGVMSVAVGAAAYFLLIHKPSQVEDLSKVRSTKTAQRQQMDAMRKGEVPHIEMEDYKRGTTAAIQLPPEDNKKVVTVWL